MKSCCRITRQCCFPRSFNSDKPSPRVDTQLVSALSSHNQQRYSTARIIRHRVVLCRRGIGILGHASHRCRLDQSTTGYRVRASGTSAGNVPGASQHRHGVLPNGLSQEVSGSSALVRALNRIQGIVPLVIASDSPSIRHLLSAKLWHRLRPIKDCLGRRAPSGRDAADHSHCLGFSLNETLCVLNRSNGGPDADNPTVAVGPQVVGRSSAVVCSALGDFDNRCDV